MKFIVVLLIVSENWSIGILKKKWGLIFLLKLVYKIYKVYLLLNFKILRVWIVDGMSVVGVVISIVVVVG